VRFVAAAAATLTTLALFAACASNDTAAPADTTTPVVDASTGGSAGAPGLGGSAPDGGKPPDAKGGAGGLAMPDASPACLALAPIAEPVEELYVAPDGNDTAAGTMAAPLKTLGAAAKRMPTGGTVIVRGGTYPSQGPFDATGTTGHALVIRAAESEIPVFDGTDVTDSGVAVIRLGKVEHVVLRGLEIANCRAAKCQGVRSSPVLDLTIRDCHIHHTDGSAARFSGKTLRLEGNHIHDVALSNENNVAFPDGGWPTCMGTAPDGNAPAAPWPDDVAIRNNRIENCWGEGIGIWFGSNVVVEGNTVDNAWNVGIYMDNAFGVRVSKNFVRMTRGIHGGSGTGILMGSEPYPGLTGAACHDVTVVNNVVVAGGGIGWWNSAATDDSNTYGAVSVLFNTVVATSRGALGFASVPAGRPAPSGCVAKNNVLADTTESSVGDIAAWSLQSNAWLNPSKPKIAGATDVSLTVALGTVAAAADVRPLASSAGTGVSGTGVTDDFACAARSDSAPTRGAFER
jgi:parallel beta-helix repeat protein